MIKLEADYLSNLDLFLFTMKNTEPHRIDKTSAVKTNGAQRLSCASPVVFAGAIKLHKPASRIRLLSQKRWVSVGPSE